MELALIAMVRMRHNRCGLALNEWGRTSLSPDRAPAGAKRLGNLLRSSRWTNDLPEELLRKGADRRLMELEAAGETALAIRDESALEDPQSKALEGLYPARSSKAARLKRIKPGYYHPTGDRRYSCQGCDGYQRDGHIPGAANVPWGQAVNANGAFKSADELSELYGGKGMDGSRETIACCRIGERSSHTWFVLSQLLGYDNVRNCDGSWTEWGGIAGAPIERDV